MLYNAPPEYVNLILSGAPKAYLKAVTENRTKY